MIYFFKIFISKPGHRSVIVIMSRKGTWNFIAPLSLLVHVVVLVLGLNHIDHTLIVKIHNFFSTPRWIQLWWAKNFLVNFMILAAGVIIKYCDIIDVIICCINKPLYGIISTHLRWEFFLLIYCLSFSLCLVCQYELFRFSSLSP